MIDQLIIHPTKRRRPQIGIARFRVRLRIDREADSSRFRQIAHFDCKRERLIDDPFVLKLLALDWSRRLTFTQALTAIDDIGRKHQTRVDFAIFVRNVIDLDTIERFNRDAAFRVSLLSEFCGFGLPKFRINLPNQFRTCQFRLLDGFLLSRLRDKHTIENVLVRFDWRHLQKHKADWLALHERASNAFEIDQFRVSNDKRSCRKILDRVLQCIFATGFARIHFRVFFPNRSSNFVACRSSFKL